MAEIICNLRIYDWNKILYRVLLQTSLIFMGIPEIFSTFSSGAEVKDKMDPYRSRSKDKCVTSHGEPRGAEEDHGRCESLIFIILLAQ